MTDLMLLKDKNSINYSKNEVVERYNFFSTCKKRNQSIDNYVIQLRNQAKTCNFGRLTDSLIRDKIIFEIQDQRLHEKLFNAKCLDLITLISIFNEHKYLQQSKQTINHNNTNIDDNTSVMNRNYCRMAKNTNNDNRLIDKKHIPPEKKQNQTLPKNTIDINVKNINDCDKKVITNINSNKKVENKQNVKKCKKCNYVHLKNDCPALGFKCEKCNMYNHFTNFCPRKCINNDKETSPSAPPLDDVLYPNLNDMETFQTNMATSVPQFSQNQKIKNKNFKKSTESLVSSCQKLKTSLNVTGKLFVRKKPAV